MLPTSRSVAQVARCKFHDVLQCHIGHIVYTIKSNERRFEFEFTCCERWPRSTLKGCDLRMKEGRVAAPVLKFAGTSRR